MMSFINWMTEPEPNGVRMSSLSGYLWKMKRGHRLLVPQWNKRWFSIEGTHLRWYDHTNSEEYSGSVDLRSVEGIQRSDTSIQGAFCFSVNSPERKLLLRASSAAEMSKWMRALHSQADLARGGHGMGIICESKNSTPPSQQPGKGKRTSTRTAGPAPRSLEAELDLTLQKLDELEKDVHVSRPTGGAYSKPKLLMPRDAPTERAEYAQQQAHQMQAQQVQQGWSSATPSDRSSNSGGVRGGGGGDRDRGREFASSSGHHQHNPHHNPLPSSSSSRDRSNSELEDSESESIGDSRFKIVENKGSRDNSSRGGGGGGKDGAMLLDSIGESRSPTQSSTPSSSSRPATTQSRDAGRGGAEPSFSRPASRPNSRPNSRPGSGSTTHYDNAHSTGSEWQAPSSSTSYQPAAEKRSPHNGPASGGIAAISSSSSASSSSVSHSHSIHHSHSHTDRAPKRVDRYVVDLDSDEDP